MTILAAILRRDADVLIAAALAERDRHCAQLAEKAAAERDVVKRRAIEARRSDIAFAWEEIALWLDCRVAPDAPALAREIAGRTADAFTARWQAESACSATHPRAAEWFALGTIDRMLREHLVPERKAA